MNYANNRYSVRVKSILCLITVAFVISGFFTACNSSKEAAYTKDSGRSDEAFSLSKSTAREESTRSIESVERPGSDSKALSSEAGTYDEASGVDATLESEQTIGHPDIKPGQLTAGEWRDLDNWQFWLNLQNNKEWSEYQSSWGFYPIKRQTVIVKNNNSRVNDAVVSLKDRNGNTVWKARTDNKGKAELFPGLFNRKLDEAYSIHVSVSGHETGVKDVVIDWQTPIEVVLDVQKQQYDILDLMFVVDTTGSMGDELEYLKSELKDVIERVRKENHNNLKIRLSINYYRDFGDEYVVRSFPFTENINEVVKQINKQIANGGGDFEEAVDEAMKDALFNHNWSDNARARLMFMVLDAPPHSNAKVKDNLKQIISKASDMGVRIIPVASSGIDKNTEFLLRFFSMSTGGTYVFLTDHSGIGNSHIEPTIGQYEVEILNELLVKIIGRYTE